MESRGAQPAMLAGLSRFLIEHEPHGAGFDVAHPTGVGTGRVSIVCRGCGSSHEYATPRLEVEGGAQPRPASAAEPREAPATASPAPAASLPQAPKWPTGQPRRPRPRPVTEKPGRRRLRPAILLIALALAALAFAGVHLATDDDEGSGERGPVATGMPPQPPKAPASPAKLPAPQPTPPQTIETADYTIEVPSDWVRSPSDQGILLEPKASNAVSLEVFSDRDPGQPLDELATASASLLQTRAGSAPGALGETELDGEPAFEATATGGAFGYSAIGATANGSRYLLIAKVAEDAPTALRRELRGVIAGLQLK